MIQKLTTTIVILFLTVSSVFALADKELTVKISSDSESPDFSLVTSDTLSHQTLLKSADFTSDIERPLRARLHQNYPNPFNPVTTISFQLDRPREVRLDIYDQLGRRVDRILNNTQPAGLHAFQYDASHLNSGVYMYRMEVLGAEGVQNEVFTRKFTLIK
ncbi:MAG: T9SS type A sorting domain-containing protein [Bacteroidota bacterium]